MHAETLLAETGFLTRLARSLTFGAEDPEDLVQETWLASLASPPRDGVESRSWLSVVLRNALRQSRRTRLRRTARELAAARPEVGTPADELRQREETRRRVVEAVLSLAEPYRTAILLRYFEELPPRKIAAKLDTPIATVKSRIARGLRQLRAALDDEYGGDRRAWAFALVPIAGRTTAWTGSGVGVAAKVGAGVAAAALLIGGGITLFGGARGTEDPLRPGRESRVAGAPGSSGRTVPPADLEVGDGTRSYGGDPALPFGPPRGGRVVDGRGEAVPGATILFAADPLCPGDYTEADEQGRFRRSSGEGREWLCACVENVGSSPWVRCREGAEDVALELAPGGVVEGLVAHPETGEAVRLAAVEVRVLDPVLRRVRRPPRASGPPRPGGGHLLRPRGGGRVHVGRVLAEARPDRGVVRRVLRRSRRGGLSCQVRGFCGSCQQKRAVLFAEKLREEILAPVHHRHFIFTIPVALRQLFLRERRLLGLLPRCAFLTVKRCFQAVLCQEDGLPGMVAAIQTFGSKVEWNCLCHA